VLDALDRVAGKLEQQAAKQAEKQRRIAEKLDEHAARQAEKQQRITEKLSEHARRHERLAEKAAKAAEQLDRLHTHLGALDVWLRYEPGARRPRFTRDDIAAAAMHIADTEGFAAVSMRRIAQDLDAGTMTLYHYVKTKDELLALLNDAVMGEVVVDGPVPDDWRAALTLIAQRTRAAVVHHPWIMDINDEPPLGPNSVRHFDQTLQAVASLPVSLSEKFDIVTTVDAYVFGYCLAERSNLSATDPQAKTETDLFPTEMRDYVNGLVRTGDYPTLAALFDEYGVDTLWEEIARRMNDDARFERNLSRVLDGIAAGLPSR
jgi:AcrR family transcriptional regulator